MSNRLFEDDVIFLQRLMRSAGLYTFRIDGDWGEKTDKAVDAFEAAFATLNYAKTVLKLERIIAITTTENKNSIKLLEKLKFVFEKMVCLSNEEEELMLFSN